MLGRMVRFTPNGFVVNVFSRRISARAPSGLPALCEVKIPRPPALLTAAASSTVPHPVNPPTTMGASILPPVKITGDIARGKNTSGEEETKRHLGHIWWYQNIILRKKRYSHLGTRGLLEIN